MLCHQSTARVVLPKLCLAFPGCVEIARAKIVLSFFQVTMLTRDFGASSAVLYLAVCAHSHLARLVLPFGKRLSCGGLITPQVGRISVLLEMVDVSLLGI